MSQTFECGSDSATYVLGALDLHERDAFTRHLETCSVCQEEIRSLQGVANVLGLGAAQYPLTRSLRRRVLKEVRADAQARERRARATSPARRREYARPRIGLSLAGAMATAVLILGIVLVSRGPTSRTRVIEATVGSAQVMLTQDGRAELIVHRLSPLSTAWTYEVWIQRRGGVTQPTPELFNVSSAGSRTVRLPNLQGVSEVMVSRERAGGAAVPSHRPVIVAKLD